MRSRILVPALAATMTLAAGCQSNPATPIDDIANETGMRRAVSTRLDALYVRPDVKFGAYTKVLLRPVHVSFRDTWRPERAGTPFRLSEADMNRLKQDFESTFMQVFGSEMQADEGFELVEAPGPGVLEVRAEVTDLFIPAPDLSYYSTTRTRTFTREGSEMTLIAEVRDSVSGEILSRAYDEGRVMRNPIFDEANRVTNRMDARRIISMWATQLRSTLDTSPSQST